MKGNSSKIARIILALCEAIVGVLLLVEPIGFTTAIITTLGVILILAGAVRIVSYFQQAPVEAAMGHGMTTGLLAVTAGLFCVLQSSWFLSAFPIIAVLYGLATLVLGVSKIGWTVDLIRLKQSGWLWHALGAAVTTLCAIVILLNPFASAAALWIFVAVSLIVEAAADLVLAFLTKGDTSVEVR